MPNRTYSANNSYRFSFKGTGNDNGVKGEGNEQDYGIRIYDPRVGRFLSVDSLFSNLIRNKPIVYIDLDGLEAAGTRVRAGASEIEISKHGNGKNDTWRFYSLES